LDVTLDGAFLRWLTQAQVIVGWSSKGTCERRGKKRRDVNVTWTLDIWLLGFQGGAEMANVGLDHCWMVEQRGM